MLPEATNDEAESHVLLPSLALGGAERIVVDWLNLLSAEHRSRVKLYILFDQTHEHPLPGGVVCIRFHGIEIEARLAALAKAIGATSDPRIVTHLISIKRLAVFWEAKVCTIPVIHNLQAGCADHRARLNHDNVPAVVAVSNACRDDLRRGGLTRPIYVIRHGADERKVRFDLAERTRIRAELRIDDHEMVVGMIGSFKAQKNYPRALHVLKHLLQLGVSAKLVIVGGLSGAQCRPAYQAFLLELTFYGLAAHVRTVGQRLDARRYYSAFDVFLNTSLFEGLSISTLEALQNGLGVVCTPVGGQAELDQLKMKLTLTGEPFDPKEIAEQVLEASRRRDRTPSAPTFFGAKLWSMLHLIPIDLDDCIF